MRNKLLSVTLTLAILFSSIVVLGMELPSAAASPAGDFEYTLEYDWWSEEGRVEITGYIGPGGDVVIPDTIDGYKVTSIADSAFYNAPITSVVVPDSVTYIGGGAFTLCTSLTNATIGNGVTVLYDSFVCCFALQSVTLGNNITEIEQNAFAYCYDLASINIPASVTIIHSRAFAYCFSLSSMVFEGNAVQLEAKWDEYRTAVPGAAPLTVYFYHGATGFSLPTWNRLPSVCLPIRPTEPRELTVKSGNENATLSWTAPADDGGAEIDHYVVYMNGTEAFNVSANTMVITNLTNGELYTFTVAAHNSAGYGLNSTEELAMPNDRPLTMVPPPTDEVDDETPSDKVVSPIDDAAGIISAEQAEADRVIMLGGFGAIAAASIIVGFAVARQSETGDQGAQGKEDHKHGRKE